jgi:hypothetical protein
MDTLLGPLMTPVAVIAPIVPSLFQVLLPIALVAGFAFLVAIPRWLLVFSYWLWCRNMPESVRHRTIPGVHASVFQGVVVNGFNDRYAFSLPSQPDLQERIAGFFRQRGARSEAAANGLSFSRGRRICSVLLPHLIPWRERNLFQNIRVRTAAGTAGMVDVEVRYDVQACCMLRLQPAGLQDEVSQLRAALANAPARN